MHISINDNKQGRIELIVGCMFAGKTEEFIRRIKRLQYAKLKTEVFKPKIDYRYSKTNIVSHDQKQISSTVVENSIDILKKLKNDLTIRVVGIDEVQFFDNRIVKIIDSLASSGYIVIVNGLDLDYRAKPFKNVKDLLPLADFLTKLHAICVVCGNLATRTQRISQLKPAIDNNIKEEPLILIGSSDKYEARCRNCYFYINKN